jgi:methionyl aminopeptidase
VLRDGDIIGVDVGVRYKNYIGDSARTFSVGEVDETSQRLLEATRKSLEAALEAARAGVRLVEVSRAVERTAREYGFGVVREYAGHGLGSQMHEDPQILNYHDPDGRFNDLVLRAGMTLAIEPMLNAGTWRTEVLEDGWTVVTRDRKRSAHFEHSIGITENGVQVLTELGS